jgi:short-subunit dehydrogenase
LARQGAAVVVVARREARLREVADRIHGQGGQAEMVVGDICDPETRERAVRVAESRLGGLDILVNNAGVGTLGLFEASAPGSLREVMEVNFFALVEMTRLALPLLKKGSRSILVNVGSIMGRRGAPHNSEYSASKFAVHGFSEALRPELIQHNIDLLVVSPGTTQTEFFERMIQRHSEPSWPEHSPVTAAHVARRTVRAIRLGKHEIIPYGLGRVLCWLNRLSPLLVDRIMAKYV